MLARSEWPLHEWERLFRDSDVPVTVDFRALVNGVVKTERYTHLIHPYPAKLLPHIPYVFLRSILPGAEATILDPFCGSGTVLLEAALCGHHTIGADTNPLARLISKVKTGPVRKETLFDALRTMNGTLARIRRAEPPPVVNIDLWYREEIAAELAKI